MTPYRSLDFPPSTECLQLRSPGESPTQPHGAEAEPQAGFRVLGFRGFGFKGLGFKSLGFWDLGCRFFGFRVSACRV